MAFIEIEDEDHGLKGLLRSLDTGINGKSLSVGVHDPSAAHPSGSTVGAVALAHEFGAPLSRSGPTPATHFLSGTFDENLPNYMEIIEDELRASLRTKKLTIDGALDKLGRIIVQNVKFKIASLQLIDTKTLIMSIGFEVE